MEIRTKGQRVYHITQAYNIRTTEEYWVLEDREYFFDRCRGYKTYGWEYELKVPKYEHTIFTAFEQNCFATKEEAQKECERRNGCI